MKAVVFKNVGTYAIEEVPMPKIESGIEILVKVDACSICGSDVHILSTPPGIDAKPGIILGHEMVGTIVEIGKDVTGFKVGDRVVMDNNIPCGVCEQCQSGHYNTCTHVSSKGVHSDGVFAQYCVMPATVATKIPNELDTDLAVFAEPVNCCMGGIKKLVNMLPGQSALVLGAGPIGLYYTKLLQLKGAGKIIVSEVSEFRSGYAKQFGANVIVNPKEEDILERILEETNKEGVDIVIDCVGTLINDAIRCVKPSGTILLFGMNGAARQTICQSDIASKNIQVLGSYIGHYTFEPTVKLLASGIADFRPMITHRITLDEFEEGIEAMRKGEALEVVIYPNK